MLAVVIGPLAALPVLFVVSPDMRAVSVVGLPLARLLDLRPDLDPIR